MHVARRANRHDQYVAVAAFYGGKVVEDLGNPEMPEFVLAGAARQAAHYALTVMRLREKLRRIPAPARPVLLTGAPVLLDGLPGCP
jgi:hypothetical protein